MALPAETKQKVLLTAGVLFLIAAVLVILLIGGNMFGRKEVIVGTTIKPEDITEFYYTYDTSTNPPQYQRYRFYVENGKGFFYHEKREGNHWPLTEADATVKGTIPLTEAEWQEFYSCLEEGVVTKRVENLDSGDSGPWLFLYWKNDKGTMQVFRFAGYGKQKAFEALCESLKNRTE